MYIYICVYIYTYIYIYISVLHAWSNGKPKYHWFHPTTHIPLYHIPLYPYQNHIHVISMLYPCWCGKLTAINHSMSQPWLRIMKNLIPNRSYVIIYPLLGGELPTNRKWVSSPQLFQWINPLLIPCQSLGWTNPQPRFVGSSPPSAIHPYWGWCLKSETVICGFANTWAHWPLSKVTSNRRAICANS